MYFTEVFLTPEERERYTEVKNYIFQIRRIPKSKITPEIHKKLQLLVEELQKFEEIAKIRSKR